MQDLEGYRSQIDEIDRALTQLFERRMEAVEGVAHYKLAHGLPVFQAAREQQVLDKVCAGLRNPAYAPALSALYRQIMSLSKEAQRRAMAEEQPVSLPPRQPGWAEAPRVGYQGVEGSFSEQAAFDFFGGRGQLKSYERFDGVCAAVAGGLIDYGVLPIENSSTGAISEVYDGLESYRLHIVGEQVERVRQHLLGLPGTRLEDIRRVYSHAQGIAQCAQFLRQYPAWQCIPFFNTAVSAKKVREEGDPTQAAIASSRAAQLYGLEVLCPDINFSKGNTTRFIVVAREAMEQAGATRASVVFHLKNEVGALQRVLHCFAGHGLNLSKIESRPLPDTPWAYRFYADFEGELEAGRLQDALSEASQSSQQLRLLGVYPKSK